MSHSKGLDDPALLKELYWGENLYQHEIADRLGVSERQVRRRFNKYDIDTRNPGSSRKPTVPAYQIVRGYPSWSGYKDKDGFSTVYVHQLLAIAKGADPFQIFSSGDYQIHHKNGVKWDNRPENIDVVTDKEHADKHTENIEKARAHGQDKYTEQECIEWLELFVDEFGFVPTAKDIAGWPGPSPFVYRSRFGSWTDAVRAAGYTPRGDTDE